MDSPMTEGEKQMIRDKIALLLRNKLYTELGWLFWDAFLLLPEGEARDLYRSEYDSIPPNIKKVMETVV